MKHAGLSSTEARNLLNKNGPNEIKDTNKISIFSILFRQVKNNFVIYLLIAAALISFFVGKDFTSYTILSVVFMVIGVGFAQEYKAEKAVSALKSMIMPVSIVRRDGKETEVASSELVVGDIVILRNGERVPADCIILEEKDLRVNEAILTGESKDLKKVTSRQSNTEESMIFMGTFIVNGRCEAQVIKTGMETKFGSIAGMISKAEKELPLQNKINNISRYMVIVALTVSVLTGLLMIMRAESLSTVVLTEILILVIALSVSAFPEGFPVVLITTLATGAARMAKQNAIVNRMSIIETLGETTVVCSDKTGTITSGEMTVKKIYLGDEEIDVTGTGFEGKGEFFLKDKEIPTDKKIHLHQLIIAGVVCNDASIERTGTDLEYKVIGTATEGALLIMGAKKEIFKEDLNITRIEEMPFNSDRKMMSVLVSEKEKFFCYAKGAPEIILNKCSKITVSGKNINLTESEKKKLLGVNKELNNQSFRTLALAFKGVKSVTANYSEDDLTFLGFVAMEDSPREGVKEALQECFNAGISVKMITGDNKETARSISEQIGLSGTVIEGSSLDSLSDEELQKVVKNVSVFARVRPEHKLRIVKALKQNGEVVTMTGDGVNDSPALKEAHIGIAMGKNGTDVSRSVADLTLKDDNFATIVVAIKEGRTIYNNIRKFVSYQLSCNLAELAILFFGVLLSPFFGWQVPLLLALHILFMNLITDNLPAITLGFNPSSKDIMKSPPRRKREILNPGLIKLLLFNASVMGTMTLFSYFFAFNILGQSVESARTTALVTLILLEIGSAFNFRSFRQKVFGRSPFTNKYLFFASSLSVLATLIILYTNLNTVFETVKLGFVSWGIAIFAMIFILALYDILKSLKKYKLLLSELS